MEHKDDKVSGEVEEDSDGFIVKSQFNYFLKFIFFKINQTKMKNDRFYNAFKSKWMKWKVIDKN